MHNDDTPGRALVLLDRAALMRLDPDPDVGMLFCAETDEPVTAGPNAANPEVYLSILCDLDQANSVLDLLGWGSSCCRPDPDCLIPHHAFAHFQSALSRVGTWTRADDRRYDDLVVMIDKVLDSPEFAAVHRELADIVLREASEPYSSNAHQKR